MARPLTDAEARKGLLQEYSDAYKSAAGFRPRSGFDRLRALPLEELYAEVQKQWAYAERVYAEEQAREQRLLAQKAAGLYDPVTSGPGWALVTD